MSLSDRINLHVITSHAATNQNLVSILENLFNTAHTIYDFSRIETLMKALKPDIQFLIEKPYTDFHYRSSFYMYYSAKYKDYERDTVRVHLFEKDLTTTPPVSEDKTYRGFFIIRPLKKHSLGHSFISPNAFSNNNFIACKCKMNVHFKNLSFSVSAFPHVAQDSETHSCAESSVWALLSYFGLKYPEYRTFSPEEIIKNLTTLSKDRLLPSTGLTTDEIAICLNASGQHCILDYVSTNIKTTKPNVTQEEDFAIMRIYVESGMPFVIALTNNAGIGHAILAIGHEHVKNSDVANFFSKSANVWDDVSFYDKKLVFIDDNYSPYQQERCAAPVTRYINDFPRQGWEQVHVRSYIVPLQKHMFLDARRAYNLVKRIFNDKNYPLANYGKKWITRLLLTKTSSFKKSLDTSTLPAMYKALLNLLNLPKFIWVCEIYRLHDYAAENASGILILDSHGDDTVDSVIFYIVDDLYMRNDGKKLINPLKLPQKFSKHTMYRNNLE